MKLWQCTGCNLFIPNEQLLIWDEKCGSGGKYRIPTEEEIRGYYGWAFSHWRPSGHWAAGQQKARCGPMQELPFDLTKKGAADSDGAVSGSGGGSRGGSSPASKEGSSSPSGDRSSVTELLKNLNEIEGLLHPAPWMADIDFDSRMPQGQQESWTGKFYCGNDETTPPEKSTWCTYSDGAVEINTVRSIARLRSMLPAIIVALQTKDEKPEETKSAPIPMLLWCPMCSKRHIDEGEFATTKVHHTHSCQNCGLTWRPAIVPTVGVQFLPGFKSVVKTAAGSADSEARPNKCPCGAILFESGESGSNRCNTCYWSGK